MFWFKNAIIYRLTKSLNWDLIQLQNQLSDCAYVPCGAQDMSKFGWVSPLRGSDVLHFSVGNQILLVAQKEEKILPANVVKRELDERIESLEQKENRKLKKVEKQILKDDVVMNLLPRAFSKNQHTALWIDTEQNLIYVDSASHKRAEDVLALLRKSLGSLPVVPLAFANEPSTVLTNWITQDSLPDWLIALEEAELFGYQENSVIRCKKQPLENEEILALLQDDKKVVSKLALEWEDTLTFVFNEDCTLKRLKFADVVREKNDDILKEDFAQRFDADFVLMTGILAKLTQNLLDEFGGEKHRE
ncbi:recombination-associated protein RdgC [Rodentibacter pneumotropicus]|uniref:recombination-associated protein RdgC n=1 Tax=Rodentibacter pneumotropicus TaxID=758 RepID=UPI00109C0637|nr:recombination-associated protein RdgC [Rodentibacter pneumotropicus]THA09428.1 recombination-associated protein RdgC [Rodentibacter pneumotropicus]THA16188.1 recombination-associated protein RdgC [Rodentibacter pneumotropicus]